MTNINDNDKLLFKYNSKRVIDQRKLPQEAVINRELQNQKISEVPSVQPTDYRQSWKAIEQFERNYSPLSINPTNACEIAQKPNVLSQNTTNEEKQFNDFLLNTFFKYVRGNNTIKNGQTYTYLFDTDFFMFNNSNGNIELGDIDSLTNMLKKYLFHVDTIYVEGNTFYSTDSVLDAFVQASGLINLDTASAEDKDLVASVINNYLQSIGAAQKDDGSYTIDFKKFIMALYNDEKCEDFKNELDSMYVLDSVLAQKGFEVNENGVRWYSHPIIGSFDAASGFPIDISDVLDYIKTGDENAYIGHESWRNVKTGYEIILFAAGVQDIDSEEVKIQKVQEFFDNLNQTNYGGLLPEGTTVEKGKINQYVLLAYLIDKGILDDYDNRPQPDESVTEQEPSQSLSHSINPILETKAEDIKGEQVAAATVETALQPVFADPVQKPEAIGNEAENDEFLTELETSLQSYKDKGSNYRLIETIYDAQSVEKELFNRYGEDIANYIIKQFGYDSEKDKELVQILVKGIIYNAAADVVGYVKNYSTEHVANRLLELLNNLDDVKNPKRVWLWSNQTEDRQRSGCNGEKVNHYMSVGFVIIYYLFKDISANEHIEEDKLKNAVYNQICSELGFNPEEKKEISTEELKRLDKNNNGWIDELYKIANNCIEKMKTAQTTEIETVLETKENEEAAPETNNATQHKIFEQVDRLLFIKNNIKLESKISSEAKISTKTQHETTLDFDAVEVSVAHEKPSTNEIPKTVNNLENLINLLNSVEEKVFYTYYYGTSARNDFDANYFLQFSDTIKDYLVDNYGYNSDFAEIITDSIIQEAISKNYKRRQITPTNYNTDEYWQISGSYNSKDIFNDIINSLQNMDFVTNPDMTYGYNKYSIFYIKDGSSMSYIINDLPRDENAENYMSQSYRIFLQIFQQIAKTNNIDYEFLGTAVFDKLCQVLNLSPNQTPYFNLEQLESLDKAGNGWLDDWFEIVNSCVQSAIEKQSAEIENLINIFRNNPNENTLKRLENLARKMPSYYGNDFVFGGNGSIYTLCFSLNGKYYTIEYKKSEPEPDTRTIDDVSDEMLNQYIEKYHRSVGSGLSSLLTGLFGCEEAFEGLDRNINYILKSLRGQNKMFPSRSFIDNLTKVLQEDYYITADSSKEDVIQRLKEYIEDLGFELPDFSEKKHSSCDVKEFLIAMDKDFINRNQTYKNTWKGLYLDKTKSSEKKYSNVNVQVIDDTLEAHIDALKNLKNSNEDYIKNFVSYLERTIGSNKYTIQPEVDLDLSTFGRGITYTINFTYDNKEYEIKFELPDYKTGKTTSDVTDDQLRECFKYSSLLPSLDGVLVDLFLPEEEQYSKLINFITLILEEIKNNRTSRRFYGAEDVINTILKSKGINESSTIEEALQAFKDYITSLGVKLPPEADYCYYDDCSSQYIKDINAIILSDLMARDAQYREAMANAYLSLRVYLLAPNIEVTVKTNNSENANTQGARDNDLGESTDSTGKPKLSFTKFDPTEMSYNFVKLDATKADMVATKTGANKADIGSFKASTFAAQTSNTNFTPSGLSAAIKNGNVTLDSTSTVTSSTSAHADEIDDATLTPAQMYSQNFVNNDIKKYKENLALYGTEYVERFEAQLSELNIVNSYIETGYPGNCLTIIENLFNTIKASAEYDAWQSILNIPSGWDISNASEDTVKIISGLMNSFGDQMTEIFEKLHITDVTTFSQYLGDSIISAKDSFIKRGGISYLTAKEFMGQAELGTLPNDFLVALKRVANGESGIYTELHRYLEAKRDRRNTIPSDLNLLCKEVKNNSDLPETDNISSYAVIGRGVGFNYIFDNDNAKKLFDFCASRLKDMMTSETSFNFSEEELNRILIYVWNKTTTNTNINSLDGFIWELGKTMYHLFENYELLCSITEGKFDVPVQITLSSNASGNYDYNDLTVNGKFVFDGLINQFFTKNSDGTYKLRNGLTIDQFINIRDYIAKQDGDRYDPNIGISLANDYIQHVHNAFIYTNMLAIMNWLNHDDRCYIGDIRMYYTKYGIDAPNTPWSVKNFIKAARYGGSSKLYEWFNIIQSEFEPQASEAEKSGVDIYQQALNKLIDKFTDGSIFYNTFNNYCTEARGSILSTRNIAEDLLNCIGAGDISFNVDGDKMILSFTFRGQEYTLESPPMYPASRLYYDNRYKIDEIGYTDYSYYYYHIENYINEVCDNQATLADAIFTKNEDGEIVQKAFFSAEDVNYILRGREDMISTYFEKVSSSKLNGQVFNTRYILKPPYKFQDVLFNNIYPSNVNELERHKIGKPQITDKNGTDLSRISPWDFDKNVLWTMTHFVEELHYKLRERLIEADEIINILQETKYLSVYYPSSTPLHTNCDSADMHFELQNFRMTDNSISFEIVALPNKETIFVNFPISS